jgi:hypothetical protein
MFIFQDMQKYARSVQMKGKKVGVVFFLIKYNSSGLIEIAYNQVIPISIFGCTGIHP